MKTIEYDIKVTGFKRELVRELLDKCTEDQKDFFNRLYGSIADIKEEDMRQAYCQCKRTLEGNNA